VVVFGVLRVGVGLGFDVRVPDRLGAVVVRRGVGVTLVDRVGLALGVVRRGVFDGVARRAGVEASLVTVVSGSSRLTSLLAVSCSTNHPMPAISTSVVTEARTGASTPRCRGRLWVVTVCSLAHLSRIPLLELAALDEPLTLSCV
jgi:hypothetical protein